MLFVAFNNTLGGGAHARFSTSKSKEHKYQTHLISARTHRKFDERFVESIKNPDKIGTKLTKKVQKDNIMKLAVIALLIT